MKRRAIVAATCLAAVALALGVAALWARPSGQAADGGSADAAAPTPDTRLVHREALSPNEEYVTSPEDVVTYELSVYQAEDGTVTVKADSNSAFFDGARYEVACERLLSEADVDVAWLTLGGKTVATEETSWSWPRSPSRPRARS